MIISTLYLCYTRNVEKRLKKWGDSMKILILDDHEVVRKGIILALECEIPDANVQEASTIEEALEVLKRQKEIEILLIDINLAGKNGLDIIEQAREQGYERKIVVLTSSSRKGDYLRARDLGVQGYILKDSNIEEITYALKQIQRDRTFFDSRIVEQALVSQHEDVEKILTEREYDVFIEIGKGLSNGQIAQKLYITENTTKKHITSILSKLDLSNRTEAALRASKLWRRKDDQNQR